MADVVTTDAAGPGPSSTAQTQDGAQAARPTPEELEALDPEDLLKASSNS